MSHLLPAGLYRLLRNGSTRSNPNPVIIGGEVSLQTAAQIQAPLLCAECEQRFNNCGERWVLQNCFRGDTFRLYTTLNAAQPLDRSPGFTFYAGSQIAGVNVDAMVYFAASVVWRAAAREWNYQSETLRLSLGPYMDAFRLYLIGTEGFPASAAVWINVWQSPVNLCVLPRTVGSDGCRHHSFTVPGISFHIFVGQRIPPATRSACAVRSPERMVFLSDRMNVPMLRGIARTVAGSKAKGSLRQR